MTIFGQSSGAQSVLIHLACPNASAGLFHRAIAQSGPSLAYRLPLAATTLAMDFASRLGCLYDDLKCLQAANTSAVLNAGRAVLVRGYFWLSLFVFFFLCSCFASCLSFCFS